MEKPSKIKIVNIKNSGDLGLKIIFATNKVNKAYYAVITEVNPCSICYKENISVGDILLAFDEINIDSYETLEKLTIYKSENSKTNQLIPLKIKKGGAFEPEGLYYACLNSPCSDVCKIIEDWKPKVFPRKSIDKTETLNSRKTIGKQIDQKSCPVDSSKNFTLSSLEDSKKQPVEVKCKLQKALPMKNRNNNPAYKATLKPKKSFRSHMITPALPTFINRKPNKNIDQETNLKESKSLSNLSLITANHPKQDSLSSDSWDSSDHSSDDLSNKFIPKIKSGINNDSFEDSIAFENNTNPLENSKRLSRSVEFMFPEFKKLPHTQNKFN